MLTVKPFDVTLGFELPDSSWEDRLRGALPRGWRFEEVISPPPLHFTLEQAEAGEFAWSLGSTRRLSGSSDEGLEMLAAEVQSTLAKFSLDYLFLRASAFRRQGDTCVLLLGDSHHMGSKLDRMLALDLNGSVRSYAEPDHPLEIRALVQIEEGPELVLEPSSPAQLAARLFQESPTPLREIGGWLTLVARLTRELPCYRLTVPADVSADRLDSLQF